MVYIAVSLEGRDAMVNKQAKRIRMISKVSSRTQREADDIVAGMGLLEPLRVVTLPDVFGRPCEVRSYFRFSGWLSKQDGATVVE
jgi:hypothetical protein